MLTPQLRGRLVRLGFELTALGWCRRVLDDPPINELVCRAATVGDVYNVTVYGRNGELSVTAFPSLLAAVKHLEERVTPNAATV